MEEDSTREALDRHLDDDPLTLFEPKIKIEIKIEPKEEIIEDPKSGVDTAHEKVSLTHKEAMEKFRDGLVDLLGNDPLLHDLPPTVTLEEVNSQIALEYGQAMTVNVKRGDGTVLPIVVVSSATVLDLKKAIQRHMMLKLERMGHTPIVSWRYIWKRYFLTYEGQQLLEHGKALKEYGIRNRDTVTFTKVLRNKWMNPYYSGQRKMYSVSGTHVPDIDSFVEAI